MFFYKANTPKMGPGVVDITPRNEISSKFQIRKILVVFAFLSLLNSRMYLGYVGGYKPKT